MKKIAILSKHYGKSFRGTEFWIQSLIEHLENDFDVKVFSNISNLKWTSSDIIIPIDGRLQVFVARILTWFNRKPMVVFGHSGLGADDKWNLLCSPNVFVAFSSYQKSWVEKVKLPWTKVIVIPHAVDLKRFTPANVKPNKNIILFVGANTAGKRIDLIKNAANLIPNSKFIAVGKGNLVEATFEEMPNVYKKADVFCFTPNPWEAFGLVFLEAMATNLPVVTTGDPIRREIVGEAGIFVDNPEDHKKLAAAIENALKKDWGNKPRAQAEKFSWGKIAIKYEELFNNLK